MPLTSRVATPFVTHSSSTVTSGRPCAPAATSTRCAPGDEPERDVDRQPVVSAISSRPAGPAPGRAASTPSTPSTRTRIAEIGLASRTGGKPSYVVPAVPGWDQPSVSNGASASRVVSISGGGWR